MLRLAGIVALALFAASASGSLPSLAEVPCDACPDDEAGGECAQGCESCACCGAPRTMPAASSAPLVAPVGAPRLLVDGLAAPPSPDPAEILHVPKRVRC